MKTFHLFNQKDKAFPQWEIKMKQDVVTNAKEFNEKFEIQVRRWRLEVVLEATGNKFLVLVMALGSRQMLWVGKCSQSPQLDPSHEFGFFISTSKNKQKTPNCIIESKSWGWTLRKHFKEQNFSIYTLVFGQNVAQKEKQEDRLFCPHSTRKKGLN